jgi:histone H3/H4
MTLYVRSAVGDYVKGKNLRVSADFYDALDSHLKGVLDKAIERAKENKRQTLYPQDL